MISKLFSIIEPTRRRKVSFYLWAAVASGLFAGAAMGLLVPFTRHLIAGSDDTLVWLLTLAGVVTASAVLYYIQALAMNNASLYVVRDMHKQSADSLLRVPLAWVTRQRVATVSDAMINGTTSVSMTVAHLVAPILTHAGEILVVAIVLVILDWQLAIALVAGGLVVWLLSRWSARSIEAGEQRIHEAHIAVQESVIDFARQQPLLRCSGVRGRDYRPLADALDNEFRTTKKESARSTFASFIGGFAIQAVLSAVIVMSVYRSLSGAIDPVDAFVIIVLAARFTGPIAEMVGLSSALRISASQLDRISEIINSPRLPEPAPEESAQPQNGANEGKPSVELVDVTFGYGDKPVLNGVSFTTSPGEVVGIVGPSGCGKTTILKLVSRFMDVTSGTVQVNGHDVRDYTTTRLMSQLAVVLQDSYLFDGTLRDNIAVGRPEASDEDIMEAARISGVTEIAERLDDGFATMVGEGGGRLSGGERQRIALARALIKDAEIVLLDEATASLDAFNEEYVLSSIRKLAQDRTVMMVAHRPSALRFCDKFVVLDENGRVESIGTAEEVAETSSVFQTFQKAIGDAARWSL